jgi:mono/diheme cytochrome c family protein
MKISFCHFGIILLLFTSSASAQSQRQLVEEGRRIFFEETFEGNGRSCGTCHPAEHNFTIDADFIATLDDDDPLFVHEHDPENLGGLENATLLRQFGLILENVDGPDSHVFRGVPHNIGMAMSITSDPELDRPGHATGWSGDGAPVHDSIPGADGSIRAFLIGGIIQHFPKTLNRVAGEDFRLPTDEELDAVEAFLLSLGRQEELDLAAMQFSDQSVDAGRRLFLGEDGVNRACTGCHANAGANNDEGVNRNFDTGTRKLGQDPDVFDTPLPHDRGFGTASRDDGFGDGTFNVPSLVEAADTPPFFHNNAAKTIEDAVAFYTSSTFANSPAGERGAFDLSSRQIDQVAAFLCAINAQENVRYGNALSVQAQRLRGSAATARIREVIAETEDAIEVLEGSPTGRFQPTVPLLRAALGHERRALNSRNDAQRNRSLQQAQDMKTHAIEAMLSRRTASR